jgi:hypothetical protein
MFSCYIIIIIIILQQNLVEFLFCTYHVFVLVFLISQLRFGTKPTLVFVLVKKYRKLGYFHACDTKLFNPRIFLVILNSYVK